MKRSHLTAFMLFAALQCCSSALFAEVGFRQLTVPDRQSDVPGQSSRPDLTTGLWYPSNTKAAKEPNTRFGHALAVDAPFIDSEKYPLILISHGFGGWYAGHANTAKALAEAGYIVAAPSHTGNHFADMSSPVERWAIDRPRHISATLDYLLGDSSIGKYINAEKVAVYGFSAGGFTALSLIGAVPDLDAASRHCAVDSSEYVCAEGMIERLQAAGSGEPGNSAWGYDDRISAAVIAAPGLAFAYTEEGLRNVQVPVQLWSAEHDHSVPHASNAAHLAETLPEKPDLRLVENANHFAFLLMPCRPAFEEEDPVEYAVVCGDAPGFDRRQFHRVMNAEMVLFFGGVLGVD